MSDARLLTASDISFLRDSWPLPGSFGANNNLWGGCSSECWPLPASFGQPAFPREELSKEMKSWPLPPFVSWFLEGRSTRTYLHSDDCLHVILKGCWPLPASFRVTVYSSFFVWEMPDARLLSASDISSRRDSWLLPGSLGANNNLWRGCSSECWPLPASFGQIASSREEPIKGMKSWPSPPFTLWLLKSRVLKGCWSLPAPLRVTLYYSKIVLEVSFARSRPAYDISFPRDSWPLPGYLGENNTLWGGCPWECWPLPASFGHLSSSGGELFKGLESRPSPRFISLFPEDRPTRTYSPYLNCVIIILKGCWPLPAPYRVTSYYTKIVFEDSWPLPGSLGINNNLWRGCPSECWPLPASLGHSASTGEEHSLGMESWPVPPSISWFQGSRSAYLPHFTWLHVGTRGCWPRPAPVVTARSHFKYTVAGSSGVWLLPTSAHSATKGSWPVPGPFVEYSSPWGECLMSDRPRLVFIRRSPKWGVEHLRSLGSRPLPPPILWFRGVGFSRTLPPHLGLGGSPWGNHWLRPSPRLFTHSSGTLRLILWWGCPRECWPPTASLGYSISSWEEHSLGLESRPVPSSIPRFQGGRPDWICLPHLEWLPVATRGCWIQQASVVSARIHFKHTVVESSGVRPLPTPAHSATKGSWPVPGSLVENSPPWWECLLLDRPRLVFIRRSPKVGVEHLRGLGSRPLPPSSLWFRGLELTRALSAHQGLGVPLLEGYRLRPSPRVLFLSSDVHHRTAAPRPSRNSERKAAGPGGPRASPPSISLPLYVRGDLLSKPQSSSAPGEMPSAAKGKHPEPPNTSTATSRSSWGLRFQKIDSAAAARRAGGTATGLGHRESGLNSRRSHALWRWRAT